jgi:DHA2 family multidrug resistance protein
MEATAILQNETSVETREWLKWAIALTVSFAAILELIDTSIVNVALTEMQGNLGATLSEVGWVVTGYSIANVIIIPLTAWLGDFFGRKGYFIFSLIGFTLASVLCGFAVNLPMLVASRILQGLCGGGLLAKAQSILFETFPREQQGQAQALFGIGVIVGPVIGPTLGGYLTDTLGWRSIFFINIPFGILAVLMAYLFLPPNTERKKTPVDWWGISLLALAIGSLQTVLEEGQQEDWFSSAMIVTLFATFIVGGLLFVWRELKTKHPAVDLRVLRHKSLVAGSIYSMILGMGLYGATFAIPIFAQSVLHYTAMQTGMLMLPSALASACMMPIIGKLSGKVDPRIMIATGAIISTIAMVPLATLNPDTSADTLFWPLMLRGIGTSFMFMSLSLATIGPLPKKDIPAATGFYNLTRQLGGSIGVAVLTFILTQREAFHRAMLVSRINPLDAAANDRIHAMTAMFLSKTQDASLAHAQAMKMIDGIVNIQSSLLSFEDMFWLVGMIFIISLPLLLLLGKGGGKAVAAH